MTEIATRQGSSLAQQDEMTVDQVVAQVQKVQQVMSAVMKENEHFGTIPGTDKPTLLKPGAEKLCMTFRLDPQYEILMSSETDELVSYTVKCDLYHITTGQRWGSGVGMCNSKERKYRWKMTPTTLNPSKEEADALKAQGKGGWRKVSNKWVWHTREEDDQALDKGNTILKMSAKRALVAAVLNATAASDIFTQDLEDIPPDVPKADSETMAAIMVVSNRLAEYAPEYWSSEALAKNIKARFGADALSDLTEEAAQAILAGALTWEASNPRPMDEGIALEVTEQPAPTIEEDEVVEAAEVEES